MKKARLILGLALVSLCASGCDAIDNIFGPTKPEEEQKDKKDVAPKSIVFSEPEITLDIGETYQIQSTVLPEGANQKVKYASYNYHIMDVSSTGVITASGDEDGNGGHTIVKVISEVDESVFANFDVYINDSEDPLSQQTITPSATSAYSDDTVTLTTNAPSASWSITSGLSFADLSATTGQSVYLVGKAAGSVTVKAVASGYEDATITITFNARPAGVHYTVTFNSNGGSISPSSTSVAENGTFTFPSPGTKTHYTFLGWSSNGGSTKYQTGATSPAITENITYTAYWQEDAKYTVTYTVDSNGSGSYSHTNRYSGSYTLLPFNSLSGVSASSGYSFKNYTVGGVNKNPGDTISLTSAIIITVNFEAEPDPSDYYNGISDSLTGTDLLTALRNLNTKKKTRSVSYAGMRQFSAICDADPDGSGKIIGFYDNKLIGPAWDSGNTWNREHVWPNARGGSKVEGDAHMVRPASTSTNSDRGSKGFGTASFDPGKYVNYYRGVASRIILYCVIADSSLQLSEDPFNHDYNNSDPSNTMGCLSDMLRWNLQYQPSDTTFTGDNDLARRTELNRNDIIEKNSSGQGNRNPFIDHPEYACKIWGNTNSTTKSICNM